MAYRGRTRGLWRCESGLRIRPANQALLGEPGMATFKALLAAKTETGPSLAWQHLTEADLMEGDVTVAVSHTTLNYKDGLALTGKAPVIRRWPMIPGIDLAGRVVGSSH